MSINILTRFMTLGQTILKIMETKFILLIDQNQCNIMIQYTVRYWYQWWLWMILKLRMKWGQICWSTMDNL